MIYGMVRIQMVGFFIIDYVDISEKDDSEITKPYNIG